MANRLEPIVADILRANGLERQTDTEFDEVANGRIWVYQFPSTAEYQLEVQTVDYRRPVRAQNAIDEANSTELFAAHLNIYIAWMANGQRTLLSAGFLQLADSSDGEQLREQIRELLRMPLATYHNAICPMGKFLRCNVDMAQSKHEIDKLRKELDELKKNNKLEMDKLKEDNQKLAMTLTTTTMELNRFRKRWGENLAAIDRKREQRAMQERKQLAMEMAIKLLNKWQHWDIKYLVVSADRRTVNYIANTCENDSEWVTVRAEHPFCFQSSSQCQMRRRICYFEVKIVVEFFCGTRIGLCDGNFPLFREWIGNRAKSFAITADGDVWMEGMNVKRNGDWEFGQDDIIGCGLEIGAAVDNGQKMHLFFTKNGTICGKRYPLPIFSTKVELFPAVTLGDELMEIKANFGQELFEYDLGKHKLAV